MSAAAADIGPSAPDRFTLYRLARQARALADEAALAATDGPQCDVARAAAKLAQLRAVLGADCGGAA